MSAAWCLSITRHKTHVQAGADYFSSCWEFKHTDLPHTFNLSGILFFIIGFVRFLFFWQTGASWADIGRQQRVSLVLLDAAAYCESVFQ